MQLGIALGLGGNRMPHKSPPAPAGRTAGQRRGGSGHHARTHDPIYVAFLKNLREARTTAGITQVDLAAALERPQSFVAKIESGERRVDVAEAMRIAAILGSSLPELLPTSDRLDLSKPPHRASARTSRRGTS